MKNKLILVFAILAVAGSFAFISKKKVPVKTVVRQSSTTEGFALRD